MRRAVKIKAYLISIAWLVIFAHGVIPHNHVTDDSDGCYELVHSINADHYDCNMPSKFESHPGETNVCHYSNFLFSQFSQDNLLISTYSYDHFYPARLSITIIINKSDPFFIIPYFGSSALRAPPSA